jgi:peptide/nickel transport system ATP-binding protein
MDTDVLLQIDGLKTYFHGDSGVVKAVDDLSITLKKGHTIGIVGESGSGKSVTSLSVLRLLPPASAEIVAGSISYLGRDLVKLPEKEMRSLRGSEISMIFQEPGTSLNPVFTVGEQVIEVIRLHKKVSRAEAIQRTIELFQEVGIPDPAGRLHSYPHEMSGGQKQRVMIAMALACNPELLIADEPTTALDVTIQRQILELLVKLQQERGMSILFISHDLGVIAEIADEVAVMYRGKLVEYGPVEKIFLSPQHPYTKGLLACRPRLDTPYRLLPTVSDFMETTGNAETGWTLTEKTVDPVKFRELTSKGRGRLYHPDVKLTGDAAKGLPKDAQLVAADQKPLLVVDNLEVYFPIKQGLFRKVVGHIKAVDGVSFQVYPRQTLGLVGESGCGKTTTGRAIVQMVKPTGGRITYNGEDVTLLSGERLHAFRGKVQYIFQDPYSSLNPRLTVSSMLTDVMQAHGRGTGKVDRRDKAAALLKEVGLDAVHLDRYPHEFSGGQRQRVSIARALAAEPEFIICDESVSALDVSVQAQVLNLLKSLQEKRGLTYIFISHDLSVVKFMSDMMAVMSAGKIVEFGPSDAIYANPQNDYTRKLIASIPDASIETLQTRIRERSERRSQLGSVKRS